MAKPLFSHKVKIHKPGTNIGIYKVICWEREAINITVTGRSGEKWHSALAVLWKD
ncbi:hypothetical protein [Noviherbaspirillum saxi]|uniref:hypothetical protein n=1 Tax=Noviherbaspirillum saxi TaxID=2320863 RepID=UPI0013141A24|nr:hypothetical protein [Noviherbaspirillum saxi]